MKSLNRLGDAFVAIAAEATDFDALRRLGRAAARLAETGALLLVLGAIVAVDELKARRSR